MKALHNTNNIYRKHFSELDARIEKEQFFAERLENFWAVFPYKELGRHEVLNLLDAVSYALIIRKSADTQDITKILESVLEKTVIEFKKRIPKMESRHVQRAFMIMDDLNLNLGHHVTSQIVEIVLESLDNASIPSIKRIVGIFSAGANIGISLKDDHLERICYYLISNLPRLAPKDTARCLRACAIYKLTNHFDKVDGLISGLHREMKNFDLDAFNNRDKNQIYDSQIVLNLPIYFNRISDPGIHSELEADFLRALEDAGAKSVLSAGYIGNMYHEIDVAVVWKKRLILLEVDGPSHYVRTIKNGRPIITGYNGGTILQSALIRKSIPEELLIRVSFHDIKEITTNTETVRQFMDKCLVLPMGVYKTESSDFGLSLSNILPETKAHTIREFTSHKPLAEYVLNP